MRTWAVVVVVGLLALLGGVPGMAAEPTAEWQTDFKKASETAKELGKYMLVNFSGSDWCGWCVTLETEVFSKAEFKTFAADNLVLVVLDFPRRKPQSDELKKQNRELMEKYGVQGFPTILVLSPKGELVGRTGYRPGGPEKYVEHLKGIIDAHKAKLKEAEKEKAGNPAEPE